MSNLMNTLFDSQTIDVPSIPSVLVTMILALGLGIVVALIYKKNYRGVMFSSNFCLTLVMLTLITAPVVLCIRKSIALSMGMVGALSIVRFRTAVKDPLDTAYMFWALTTGILLGAGQYLLTCITVAVISLFVTLLVNIRFKEANSYLLVVRMSDEAERAVSQMINGMKVQRLKTKTVTASGVEATYEVRAEKPDALLNKLHSINGVHDATLVAYSGETA